jgi:hypothetical protein
MSKRKQPYELKVTVSCAYTSDYPERLRKVMALLLCHKNAECKDNNNGEKSNDERNG